MSNKKKETKTEDVINNEAAVNDAAESAQDSKTEVTEENETDRLAREKTEWQDKYARLSAEFDNFRKRTLKEKMELVSTAASDTIMSVLTILDDLERAVEANKKTEDIEVVRTGVELIHKKFGDILKNKGVTEIEALGQPLDTDLHEAIAKFPVAEEEKKGKIIDVVERGYKLKDKVIRFSKVVVGE